MKIIQSKWPIAIKEFFGFKLLTTNIEVTAGVLLNEAIEDAESRIESEKFLVYYQNNLVGLGSITTQKVPRKNTRDY